MIHVQLEVTLQIRGPLLSQSTTGGSRGLDAEMRRAGEDRPCLPGTLLRGKLREAWGQLRAAGALEVDIEALLGPPFEHGVYDQRGRLVFHDLIHPAQPTGDLAYRIRVDEETGSVRPGFLQAREDLFRAGQVYGFTGTLHLFARDQAEVATVRRALLVGLRYLGSVGAGRTLGLGRVVAVTLSEPRPHSAAAVSPALAAAAQLRLDVAPRGPFCIARRPRGNNIYESEDFIPGGVLKGTLVRMLRSGDEALRRNLPRLRLRHAFPSANATRPTWPALTLVMKPGTEDLLDLALRPPGLFRRGSLEAPRFALGSKLEQRAWDQCGWPSLKRELLVRTKMEEERRRPHDGALFAMEAVVPQPGQVWRSVIDLLAVPAEERAQVIAELQGLCAQGLVGLGKTKTQADVTFAPSPAPPPPQALPLDDGTTGYVLTLQTRALLADPRFQGLPAGATLRDAYAAIFQELSGGALSLVRFFAGQELAGGVLFSEFERRRRQQGRAPQAYNPYLLTSAGSVFVLRAVHGEAPACVAQWQQRGLPLPGWAIQRYGDTWETCPLTREDGFGEVAINLPQHLEPWPADLGWEPIEALGAEAPLDAAPDLVLTRGEPPQVAKRRPPPDFRQRWTLTGTLTTTTRLHLGSGAYTKRDDLQIDAVLMDHRPLPYLSGQSLKGVLRAFLQGRTDEKTMAALFGSLDQERATSCGGKVEFLDAFLQEDGRPTGTNVPYWDPQRCTGVAAAVAIERAQRVARAQHLYHQEFVPPGARFAVRLEAEGLEPGELRCLLAGLSGFNDALDPVALGADVAGGQGRLRWVLQEVASLTKERAKDWAQAAAAPEVSGQGLALAPALLQRSAAPGQVLAPRGERLVAVLQIQLESPFLVKDHDATRRTRAEGDKIETAMPLRDQGGNAYLPARSLRGVLRSQAERIVRTLWPVSQEDALATRGACALPTHHKEGERCLCCQLFGAPSWRGLLELSDFTSSAMGEPEEQTFVAIDRFTGGIATAPLQEGEVKGKGLTFRMKGAPRPLLKGQLALRLQRGGKQTELWMLGLLALVLRDLAEGDLTLGAAASRGYGVCRLTEVAVSTPVSAGSAALSGRLAKLGAPDWQRLQRGIHARGEVPEQVRALLAEAVQALRTTIAQGGA